MSRCWFCRSKMIWQSDFSYEDMGYEGDGIVAILSCTNMRCEASAEFAQPLKGGETMGCEGKKHEMKEKKKGKKK